jgi:hypothetical protein
MKSADALIIILQKSDATTRTHIILLEADILDDEAMAREVAMSFNCSLLRFERVDRMCVTVFSGFTYTRKKDAECKCCGTKRYDSSNNLFERQFS